jgi:hypothetical protein
MSVKVFALDGKKYLRAFDFARIYGYAFDCLFGGFVYEFSVYRRDYGFDVHVELLTSLRLCELSFASHIRKIAIMNAKRRYKARHCRGQ